MKRIRFMNAQRGFTLIEVMITVAIIAILLSVALPSYQEYMMRGKIPEATSTLMLKRVQMEQYFQDNRTYVGAQACVSDTTTSAYFDFSCSSEDAEAYTLQATGKDSMTDFAYTINQANQRVTTSVPTGWTSSANCWIRAKGGAC